MLQGTFFSLRHIPAVTIVTAHCDIRHISNLAQPSGALPGHTQSTCSTCWNLLPSLCNDMPPADRVLPLVLPA